MSSAAPRRTAAVRDAAEPGAGEDADAKPTSIAHRRQHARRESTPGYAEKRERLLAGAAEVFKAKGFRAASINDIAKRFGGDRASVYYYYGSKHEIFIDLIRQAVEEVVVLAEAAAGSPEPADVRLRLLLQSTLEAYDRHYPYMFVYIQEDMNKVPGDGSSAGTELEVLAARFTQALEDIVADGLRAGSFRSDVDPMLLMFAVTGAINWTHRWYTPEGRKSGSEVGAAFADFLLDGVRGPAEVPARGQRPR